MEIFKFRKFEVRNERSAMKVNTDGVLLGVLMTLTPQDRALLDIGTGTGTVALIAAQRLSQMNGQMPGRFPDCISTDVHVCVLDHTSIGVPDHAPEIIGIDIDEASAQEAAENFAVSPWSGQLTARHISLSDFETECGSGCPFGFGSEFGAQIKSSDTGAQVKTSDAGAQVKSSDTGVQVKTSDAGAQDKYSDAGTQRRFDLIFSNPPYFEGSLKAPDIRRRTARHAESMSYREIIAFAARHLSFPREGCFVDAADHIDRVAERNGDAAENGNTEERVSGTAGRGGRLSMIIPCEAEREAVRYAASFGLELFRCVRIRTTPQRLFSRSILEFSRSFRHASLAEEEITIQNKGGYSDEYRSLMKDFLYI